MNAMRALVAIAVAAAAAPASAYVCYAVIDRNEAVLYQSQNPPIDLTDPGAAGAAARNALRARGQLLLVFDSERCVERVPTPSAKESYATVDEIVMGFKNSALRPSSGVSTSGIFGVAGDGGGGGYGYGGYGGYGGYADYGGVGAGDGGWGPGYARGYLGGERGVVGGERGGVGDAVRGGVGGGVGGRR